MNNCLDSMVFIEIIINIVLYQGDASDFTIYVGITAKNL